MSTSTQFPKKPNDYPFYALVLLAILILALCLTSCMTNRKGELTEKGKNFIALHCKGEDSISHSDNTVIEFDTLKIPYPVQGETIYLKSPCDSLGNLKPVNIKTKKNGLTTSLKSVGNVLIADSNSDSLMYIIETQKQVINDYKNIKTVIEKPCNKDHLTGFKWFLIYCGYILLGFILLQIIVKILMTIYPVTRPFLTWLYWLRF